MSERDKMGFMLNLPLKYQEQSPVENRLFEMSIPLSRKFTNPSIPKGYLQSLVKKNKVERLVINFISKLKRSVAFRTPSN